MDGRAAIARILKLEGQEYLFCFPNNPIIDAVANESIKPVMVRTERTAVGMADGYTRVTSGTKIGVCAVQNGPGAENAFGGVAQAYSDSTPLLMLPGGEPQSRLGQHPNFDAVKNYQHVTKWAERINQVDRIPELMRRAFTYLRMGRPGPVLLEAPLDVLAAEYGNDIDYTPPPRSRSMAAPADIRAALAAVLDARQPVIHAGLGVLYSQAWDELREFAEFLQIPVMTTLTGKSAFPEDHPLALGNGGRTGTLPAARLLEESDCIIAVGSSMAISNFAAPIPPGKVAVQINNHEFDINKAYPVAHPLLGDAQLVLQELLEEARHVLGPDGRRGDDRVVRHVADIKKAWLDEWMPKLTSDETPINPYRVVWELQQVLDVKNVIVTHDAGSPRDQLAPFWTTLQPHGYIGWGKSTHLGYGMALAFGAKLARPDRTVVNVMGDAAFGMIGMDVETAVRNNIGVLTVIMNNSCLGGYEKHMPVATRRYGTRFLGGEYWKVADGLGAYAARVERPDELGGAVKRALEETKNGRPAVLEVITVEDNAASKYW